LARLFTVKIQAEGFSLEVATISGGLLALIFQAGSYFAIPAGYLGDRWQRRSLRGRALFSMIGIVATVPFHIAFFLMPLPGLNIPEQGGMIAIALATLTAIFSNGAVALAFFIAVMASVLIAIDGPNRAALITDVNLPEHRGTVVGLSFLAGGMGAALSNFLIGLTFAWLARYLAEPWNYAIGMSFFILLLLPAGWCYYQISRTSPDDIQMVRRTLAERAHDQSQSATSIDIRPAISPDTQTNPLP
jgi:MFS family permease